MKSSYKDKNELNRYLLANALLDGNRQVLINPQKVNEDSQEMIMMICAKNSDGELIFSECSESEWREEIKKAIAERHFR